MSFLSPPFFLSGYFLQPGFISGNMGYWIIIAPKRTKGWSSSNCFTFLLSLQCSFWDCLDVKSPAPESLLPWHVENVCLCSCTIYFGAAKITRKVKLMELHSITWMRLSQMRFMGHIVCVSFVRVLVERRGSSQLHYKAKMFSQQK